MSAIARLTSFMAARRASKKKLSQLERYRAAGAPAAILDVIELGGGTSMGVTMEEFARSYFPSVLRKRRAGKTETGYDHILRLPDGREICVEQKSAGLWGDDEESFRFQHVEPKHKWDLLLLCGIGYTDVRFWTMNKATFGALVAAGKITNQGCATGESAQGMWFNFADVKDSLREIRTEADLVAAAAAAPVAP